MLESEHMTEAAAEDPSNPESEGAGARQAPVRLAVFDFDGTCISGNSPVLLVLYLMRRGMLGKSVLARIALWGVAYKFRLPQNESWVRALVFSAFEGRPRREVDDFLAEFYDSEISPLFRAQADAAMRERTAEGCEIVVVSATFEPIILRAMKHHPFALQASTRMRIASDGTYTREVEGLPVEGTEKVAALERLANARFGEGNWRLAYAYGDHHSDRDLLSSAERAFAVAPDRPLARTARRCGWEILEWD